LLKSTGGCPENFVATILDQNQNNPLEAPSAQAPGLARLLHAWQECFDLIFGFSLFPAAFMLFAVDLLLMIVSVPGMKAVHRTALMSAST
jgi:hypothetical protein